MADDIQHNDVATYAAEVRAQLADLPPEERDALLEDLEDHLAEVAAESDTPLATRLGTPQAYAQELRLAYGITHKSGPRRFRRTRLALQAGATTVSGWRTYRAIREYLPELRPAWWVLRAYLAVLVLAVIFRGGDNLHPIPNPFSSHGLLQIIATAVAIAFSVQIGRRAAQLRRSASWFLQGANAMIAIAGLIALGTMGTGYAWADAGPSASQQSGPFPNAYAMGPVSNIYPYSIDGKPLESVLLYDQNGRPLIVGGSGFGFSPQYPTAADGQPIMNEYPLKVTGPDGSVIAAPRVALPPVSSMPRSSPSANPSASPTP